MSKSALWFVRLRLTRWSKVEGKETKKRTFYKFQKEAAWSSKTKTRSGFLWRRPRAVCSCEPDGHGYPHALWCFQRRKTRTQTRRKSTSVQTISGLKPLRHSWLPSCRHQCKNTLYTVHTFYVLHQHWTIFSRCTMYEIVWQWYLERHTYWMESLFSFIWPPFQVNGCSFSVCTFQNPLAVTQSLHPRGRGHKCRARGAARLIWVNGTHVTCAIVKNVIEGWNIFRTYNYFSYI